MSWAASCRDAGSMCLRAVPVPLTGHVRPVFLVGASNGVEDVGRATDEKKERQNKGKVGQKRKKERKGRGK